MDSEPRMHMYVRFVLAQNDDAKKRRNGMW